MGQKATGWRMHWRAVAAAVVLAVVLPVLSAPVAAAQTLSPVPQERRGPNLLTDPGATPEEARGVELLYKLDREFSDATAKGGGKAFASWFAPDGVTLGDGRPPVEGQGAIAAVATWAPSEYQLTWAAAGARMSPEGDYGFTWGTYTGVVKDKDGDVSRKTGRYILVWKRQMGGQWRVELDASNTGPAKDDCCRLP